MELKKIRIFKRIRELEEYRKTTDKAFGILVSEMNDLKRIQDKSKTSVPESNIQMNPKEFMKWFISNSQ